jgi:hypothetical protein
MEKLIGSLKSKTSWFAAILVVLGALQTNMEVVTNLVGAANIGWVMSAIGAVVYVLRMATSKPLEDK